MRLLEKFRDGIVLGFVVFYAVSLGTGAMAQETVFSASWGDKPGQARIQLCDSHSLSSLSTGWIESVRTSGRYAQCTWAGSQTVDVTTLDDLISRYGRPAFIKMDVEGYEYEALKGLSRPVKSLCFEFTPEFIDSTRRCIDHLAGIGSARFNYCLQNAPTSLQLAEWQTADRMKAVLDSLAAQRPAGDIYAGFDV